MVMVGTFPEHALRGANENTLGQLTNHSTFCISEGVASSKHTVQRVQDWGERGCNNVK